jgi:hypothetical protein
MVKRTSVANLPMRGTLLNFLTVAVGGTLGWLSGQSVPSNAQSMMLSGLGLVSLALGIQMFLGVHKVLVVTASILLGGIVGAMLNLNGAIESFAAWAQTVVGQQGSSTFIEAVVVTSVLFCVGPMTLLGCIADGLEGKIDLLAVKSALDGVAAFFFAAALGPGVLVTAVVVLVVQGSLTLAARWLKPLADDRELLNELTAAGGVLMLGIGFGLLELKKIPMSNFLPSLVFAPLLVVVSRRFSGLTQQH